VNVAVRKKTQHERRKKLRLLFRRRLHRRFRHKSFLPNLFTLGNAFFGFCALVLIAEHDFFAAAQCILLGGVLFDQADGRIARHFESTSELGVQLDSLADAITFCCAPAFLMYTKCLRPLGFLGIIPAAAFLLAGIFRLARFNVSASEQSLYFKGLPTGTAGCLITLAALQKPKGLWGEELLYAGILILAGALMASAIPFPTFKHWKIPYFKVVFPLAALLGFAVSFIFGFYHMILCFIGMYIIGGLCYALFNYLFKK
jgi:CDP-diacylglycerol--serine O-phosphatidyltransferase